MNREEDRTMRTTVTYLFDPLCGWCYGASPVIQQLGQQPDIQMELAPNAARIQKARGLMQTFGAHPIRAVHGHAVGCERDALIAPH
jgi:protein-disulfide isomerase-like protein with CxxC motif